MRFGSRQVIAGGRHHHARGGDWRRPARRRHRAARPRPPAKPTMVEDVFKNVQALKGIGVDDFMLTMGIMSAAVGSDCVGLSSVGRHRPRRLGARHAEKADRAPHGADGDRHQPRQLQRTPGRDLLDLSSRPRPTGDHADAGRGVRPADRSSPTTCSRRRRECRRSIRCSTSICRRSAAPRTSRASPASSPPGRASAIAGLAAAASSTCRRRRPTSARRTSASPSIRTAASASGPTTAGPAGSPRRSPSCRNTSWREASGTARDWTRCCPSRRRSSRRSRTCASVRRRRSTDKDVTVLQGNGPNGTLATLYFDDASGLLVRMVRHGRSPIGRVPTQVDYSDYRDVGGIKFPFRWTFAWLDGRDNFEFSDVKLNVPIDAAKFGEPNVARCRRSIAAWSARGWRRLMRACCSVPRRRLSRRCCLQHRRPRRRADAAFSSFFQARTAPGGCRRLRSDRRERHRIRRGVRPSPAGPRLLTRRAARRRAGKLSQRDR